MEVGDEMYLDFETGDIALDVQRRAKTFDGSERLEKRIEKALQTMRGQAPIYAIFNHQYGNDLIHMKESDALFAETAITEAIKECVQTFGTFDITMHQIEKVADSVYVKFSVIAEGEVFNYELSI